MGETSITYIKQASILLKAHYQILLIPLFIGFVSNILSVLPGDGLYTLSLIGRISIIAIIPVIYGRINEIVCNRDFKSWKNLFSKYFLKYVIFIVTIFLVMSVPVVILTTLGAFQIINFNLNHVLTAVSILYHLIALYVVPLLFYENTIKESIMLGFKCLFGNLKFNLPIIFIALILSLLSRSYMHKELGISIAFINYIRWCSWFTINFILFISISMILKDKIYNSKENKSN